MKIIIVGAGILGRLCAFHAVARGHEVCLMDAGPWEIEQRHVASTVAAGMLTPVSELDLCARPSYVLGKGSIAAWQQVIAELPAPVFLAQAGTLVMAHPTDEAELAQYARRVKRQLTAPESSLLQPVRADAIEPELPGYPAYHFPAEGHVDSQMLMRQLGRYLAERVEVRSSVQVTEVLPHAVAIGSEQVQADWVIDCRGMAPNRLYPELRPVRGELVWVRAKGVRLQSLVRLLHPRYRVYMVPRPDNIYLIGATDIETHDQRPISVRSVLELLTAATSVHKGFLDAEVITTRVGQRPTLPNHLPEMCYAPGLVAINGLYRHGFLLAPKLVELAMQYVCGGERAAFNFPLWRAYDHSMVS